MEKDLENKIRDELYEKFLIPLKNYEGYYELDKEIMHYFSFEAPIELVKKVKDNFDYNKHFLLARNYWNESK